MSFPRPEVKKERTLEEVIASIKETVGKMQVDAKDAKAITTVPESAKFLPQNEFKNTKLSEEIKKVAKDFSDFNNKLAAGGSLAGMADSKAFKGALEKVEMLRIEIQSCFDAALDGKPNLKEMKDALQVALDQLDRVKEPTVPERSDEEQKAVDKFVENQKKALNEVCGEKLRAQMEQLEKSLKNQRENNFSMMQAYQLKLHKVDDLWQEWADGKKLTDAAGAPLVMGGVDPATLTKEMERRIAEMQKALEGQVFKRKDSIYSIHCEQGGGIKILPHAKTPAEFKASIEEGIKFLKIKTKPEITTISISFSHLRASEIKLDEIKAFIEAVHNAGLKVKYPLEANIREAIVKAGPKEEALIQKMIKDTEESYNERLERRKKGEGVPAEAKAIKQKVITTALDERMADIKSVHDEKKGIDASSSLEDVLAAKPTGDSHLKQLLDAEVQSLNERIQRVDSAYAQIDALREDGRIPDAHKEKARELVDLLDAEVKNIKVRQEILRVSSDHALEENKVAVRLADVERAKARAAEAKLLAEAKALPGSKEEKDFKIAEAEVKGLEDKFIPVLADRLADAKTVARQADLALTAFEAGVAGGVPADPVEQKRLMEAKKAADAAVVTANNLLDIGMNAKKPSSALVKLNTQPELKSMGDRAEKLAHEIKEAKDKLDAADDKLAPRSAR